MKYNDHVTIWYNTNKPTRHALIRKDDSFAAGLLAVLGVENEDLNILEKVKIEISPHLEFEVVQIKNFNYGSGIELSIGKTDYLLSIQNAWIGFSVTTYICLEQAFSGMNSEKAEECARRAQILQNLLDLVAIKI
jgi:hypothetical protein